VANDPTLAELIDSMNHRLNEAIAVKRRIIENLRPSTLSMLGLHVALENLCADAHQQLNNAIAFMSDIDYMKLSG
jgi:signal transduction histidine kinase